MVDECFCYRVVFCRSGAGRGKGWIAGIFTAPSPIRLHVARQAVSSGAEWMRSAQLRIDYPWIKGFCSATPSRSKSSTFRVTTVSRCILAIAAIMASSANVSDLRCMIRAHSRKAAERLDALFYGGKPAQLHGVFSLANQAAARSDDKDDLRTMSGAGAAHRLRTGREWADHR